MKTAAILLLILQVFHEDQPSPGPPGKGWAVGQGMGEVALQRGAENLLRRDTDQYVRPMLWISCDPLARVNVAVTGFMVGIEPKNPVTIPLRFDAAPLSEAGATGAGAVLFLDKPKRFIRLALGHKGLMLRLQPYNQPGSQDIYFKLDGLDAAIKPLFEGCGWDPTKPSQGPGRPPPPGTLDQEE